MAAAKNFRRFVAPAVDNTVARRFMGLTDVTEKNIHARLAAATTARAEVKAWEKGLVLDVPGSDLTQSLKVSVGVEAPLRGLFDELAG